AVFDLETTGLSAARDSICELGAVRVQALELVDSFQSLVKPAVPLPEPVANLTGLLERDLRRAPSASTVVRSFLAFAGDDLLVAHNARFDQRFLERQLLRLHGRRLRNRRCVPRGWPAACSRGDGGGSGSPLWPSSSASRRGPATAPCPTPRRRRRYCCT